MKGIQKRPWKTGKREEAVPASFFIDTNVILYLLSADDSKAARAESLLKQGGHVSVQVLNEFASVARRKAGLSWQEIHSVLGVVRHFCKVHPLTEETHQLGLLLAEKNQLSLYDAMIAATAILAGCTVLYSEDFQHGMLLGGSVIITNPFLQTTTPDN